MLAVQGLKALIGEFSNHPHQAYLKELMRRLECPMLYDDETLLVIAHSYGGRA